jgi:predicted O-methyltransferase YrrM
VAEAAAWYDGKTFAFDWTSWHFPIWFTLMQRYRGRRTRVLEVGSWEGRSALFFLNYLPRSHIVCIDTFAGGKEHRQTDDFRSFLRRVERRFDTNTRPFGRRVEKIKATSSDALAALGRQDRRFDIAYIDGSHLAADVLSDATLTWPLIAPGGLVIFDDYLWDNGQGPSEIPKPGIDAFLAAIKGHYRLVWNGYQIAIVKL